MPRVADSMPLWDRWVTSQLSAWVAAAVLILVRLSSSQVADASYPLIACYALLGRPEAVRALFISWFLTMVNPGLAPEASYVAVGRYAVLFAAAFSTLWHSGYLIRRHAKLQRLTLATASLGAAILVHSLIISPLVDVSALKAISWMFVMTTLVAAWGGMTAVQRSQVEGFVFLGLVAIAIFSLPLIGTGTGVLRNGHGFQGVLNHPQAFGPVMGILAAWSISRFFAQVRPNFWLLGLAALCFGLVLISEARTAGFASSMGVVSAIVLVSLLSRQSFRVMLPGLQSARGMALLLFLFVVALLFSVQIGASLDRFISKSERIDVSGVSEAYERSRGYVIDEMTTNIAEHPLTGIGFGIASDPFRMVVDRDPVFGIPVGAAIEKGVAPYMVVEELGAPMAFLVALWVFALVRRSARGGLVPLTVTLTVLAMNLGEANLFSPGAQGLLMLILLAWAATHAPHSAAEPDRTLRASPGYGHA